MTTRILHRERPARRPGPAGLTLALLGLLLLPGCRTAPVTPVVPHPEPAPAPAPTLPAGDEFIVAGRRFPAGTRVVTWHEPGGYDAYRGGPPPHHGVRLAPARPGDKGERKKIPAGLGALQGFVDQLVLHYDNIGLSRLCFDVLQRRALSAHFLIDVDGTVYQTLDLQERALHATTSNSRSIGVELAHIGAYPPADTRAPARWYQPDAAGRIRLTPPQDLKNTGILTAGFTGRPARPAPVRGAIQGRELRQYDFTPEQYQALARLTAALGRVFPLIKLDYPRDAAGRLVRKKLPDATLERYQGILGHYHVQENKTDPGPAFDWDKLIKEAQEAGKRAAGPERKAPPAAGH